MRTLTWAAASSSVSSTAASGSRIDPPVKAAISRARPTMLSASPRLGLTSTSSTVSPTTSATGEPSAISSSRPRMWMPSASVPRPSSAALHSIPWLTSPRIFVRSMRRSPGSTAPTSAVGTSWPASRFWAPHTMSSSPPALPTSTRASHSVSAFGWRLTSRTRPTTTSVQSAPAVSIVSTSIPRIVSSSASARGERSNETYSRSQESGTRIGQCPAGNWVAKRRSALKKSRMSPMPWRSIVIRSGPIPKA